jgi:hypothetical protein
MPNLPTGREVKGRKNRNDRIHLFSPSKAISAKEKGPESEPSEALLVVW